jgi:riboflavin synthase alpha subunit
LSKPGDIINLEIDVLARYVARLKQAEDELGDAS